MFKTLVTLRKRVAIGLLARGINIPAPFVEKYAELIHLKRLLDEKKVDCVLDVGANIGQFAQDLRQIGYTGFIVSFEPVKETFVTLTGQFAGDPNWLGFQTALGNEPGELEFNIGKDTKYSSALAFNNAGDVDRTEKVPVQRLDELIRENKRLATSSKILLKMDTQGFDLEVFAGASGCIDGIVAIMSEVSVIPLYEGMKSYKESLTIYEDAGFRLTNLSTVNRTAEGQIVELNCILSR